MTGVLETIRRRVAPDIDGSSSRKRALENGASSTSVRSPWPVSSITPMLMKKGRPAHTVSALCTHNLASAVRQTLFTHTSTIGVREYEVTKRELARRSHSVTVRGHEIGVKVTWADGEIKNLTPEWDDLDAAARSLGMAAKEVMTEALLIARDMSQAWTEESG